MHILVIGAAGMVGRKLIERLAGDGQLGGRGITQLTAADVVEPEVVAACRDCPFPMKAAVADISTPGEAGKAGAERPEVIFHLAPTVSGEAEGDFDKGHRIKLDGARYLFPAIRKARKG